MNVISAILRYLGSAFLILLTLTTGTDVVGRYLFNSPLPGAFDITVNLLTLIAGCGIALTTAAEDHIKVDSLFAIVPPFWQKVMRLFGYLLEIIIFSVLFFQGVLAVYHSITPFLEVSLGTPFPLYPYRLALAVAFLLSLIATVHSVVRFFRGSVESDMPDESRGGV